jgi:hypothetical protein
MTVVYIDSNGYVLTDDLQRISLHMIQRKSVIENLINYLVKCSQKSPAHAGPKIWYLSMGHAENLTAYLFTARTPCRRWAGPKIWYFLTSRAGPKM